MKKIISLSMLLFVCFGAFAQGTTQKEFNYLSKGYADDLAMGKDIIQGYKLEDVNLGSTSTVYTEQNKSVYRISKLYKLVRIESGKIAGFLLEEYVRGIGPKTYTCIPNAVSDGEMLLRARNAFTNPRYVFRCVNYNAEYSYSWNMLMILSNVLSN